MNSLNFNDSLDIKGYYLPSHYHFNRLIKDQDKTNYEFRLIALTVAGCLIRNVNPLPDSEQLEHLYQYLRFLVNEYPGGNSLRPAVSLYFERHKNCDITQLMLVSKFEELAAQLYHEIIASDPLPQYTSCVIANEPPAKLRTIYRSLLWLLIIDRPELMKICAETYALETLTNLQILREE